MILKIFQISTRISKFKFRDQTLRNLLWEMPFHSLNQFIFLFPIY